MKTYIIVSYLFISIPAIFLYIYLMFKFLKGKDDDVFLKFFIDGIETEKGVILFLTLYLILGVTPVVNVMVLLLISIATISYFMFSFLVCIFVNVTETLINIRNENIKNLKEGEN